MSLMALFSSGNPGNPDKKAGVTDTDPVLYSRNPGNPGNPEKNTVKVKNENNSAVVSCGKCQHFKSNNQHGRGAGYCLIGGAFGSWSESPHQCTQFDAAVKWVELPDPKPDALTVTCYTPNGKPIKVQARDPEHASYLIRTNPKPQEIK